MAPPVLTNEPDELIQGDTWQWTISEPDYPASDGWVLSYDLAGASALTFSATTDPDGASFDILVAATATQKMLTGSYTWNGYVVAASGIYAGQRRTIRRGTFRIIPNFTGAAPGTAQHFAEKMVAVIENELLARIPGSGAAHQAYSIEGRSISKIPIAELHTLRNKYKVELIMASRGGRLPTVGINFSKPFSRAPWWPGD